MSGNCFAAAKTEPIKKIKVLQVISTLDAGGIERLVVELIKRIDPHVFDVEVCCVGGAAGLLANEIESQVQVHTFGHYRKAPLAFFRHYRQLIKNKKYDIIHCHLNHFSWLFLTSHSRKQSIGIAHFHNDFSQSGESCGNPLRGKVARALSGKMTELRADVVLGISSSCLSSVFGSGWSGNPRIRRMYNGIDIQGFGEAGLAWPAAKARLGLDRSKIVLGHVGRFRPQKNHEFLIALAEQLASESTSFHFLLVGDGPLQPAIQERLRQKGLAEFFTFAGTTTDVGSMLAAMDIFVFPSLWEGFGLAVVEAQAAGLPVLASDAIPKEIPILYPSKRLPLTDVGSWVAGCLELIRQAPNRQQLIESAAHGLSEFSVEGWVNQLEKLYKMSALQ